MKRVSILLVVVGLLVMFSGTAFAAKGGLPGPPTTTPTGSTTTTTTPEYWTCQARIDNGASAWVLGSWNEGHYSGSDIPSCIDIRADDLDITSWKVEWSGSTVKGTVKGLKLVFEEEVHGTAYAETVITSETGTWEPSWCDTGIGNLVFVAMPHSGDRWVGLVTFVVTPIDSQPDPCPTA